MFSKLTNTVVDGSYSVVRTRGVSTTHMIILALDYKRTQNPLTCTIDGNNMQELARCCGVEDVRVMYDEQCTKDNVRGLIQEVGASCNSDDVFVFYYSGHGTNLKDMNGDEEDGQDEAFCFVDTAGQISYESCMTDDEFAEIITSCIPKSVDTVILTDCCHSGSIADLSGPMWNGCKAISITGCLDGQTSGDIGRGGIMTHSLLMAIDNLNQLGISDYSVGKVFNGTLAEDKRIFNSAQDITIQWTSSTKPNAMAWPLRPTGSYTAPLKKGVDAAIATGAANEDTDTGAQALQALLAANPNVASELGISQQMLNHVVSGSVNIVPDNFLSKIEPCLPTCFCVLGLLVHQVTKKR